jgi:hypothetical protein
MNVYVDTSVILRVIFREPDPVSDWGNLLVAARVRAFLK